MLLAIQPIVIVSKDIKVMHLSVARKLQSLMYLKILAIHRHAVKMLNAHYTMVLPNASVYHRISVILIQTVADQNVSIILIVQEALLAFVIIAEIHALECAVLMHSAQLSIIYPLVRVKQAIKAIHLLDVEENKYNVSGLLFD